MDGSIRAESRKFIWMNFYIDTLKYNITELYKYTYTTTIQHNSHILHLYVLCGCSQVFYQHILLLVSYKHWDKQNIEVGPEDTQILSSLKKLSFVNNLFTVFVVVWM